MSIELPWAVPLSEERLRDIVRIPSDVFSLLEISEGDYVCVSGIRSSCRVRAIELTDKGERVIRIRQNLRNIIGVRKGELISIKAMNLNKHIKLKTHIPWQQDVGKCICRLHQSKFSKLQIVSGDWMEIFNLNTYGRIFLKADMHDLDEDLILLDKYSRRLLDIDETKVSTEKATVVGVRKADKSVKNEGFFASFWKIIIGYKWLSLRVIKGEDADEGKNIVRLRKDNLLVIGAKEGDIVEVNWRNKKESCRVLQIVEQQNRNESGGSLSCDSSLVICLCSTERRKLGADLFDVVRIRRSPWFVLRTNFDRAILTGLSALGVYASLVLQLRLDSILATGISLMVGAALLWLLFAKVRSEV
jgi:hypothetical protein